VHYIFSAHYHRQPDDDKRSIQLPNKTCIRIDIAVRLIEQLKIDRHAYIYICMAMKPQLEQVTVNHTHVYSAVTSHKNWTDTHPKLPRKLMYCSEVEFAGTHAEELYTRKSLCVHGDLIYTIHAFTSRNLGQWTPSTCRSSRNAHEENAPASIANLDFFSQQRLGRHGRPASMNYCVRSKANLLKRKNQDLAFSIDRRILPMAGKQPPWLTRLPCLLVTQSSHWWPSSRAGQRAHRWKDDPTHSPAFFV